MQAHGFGLRVVLIATGLAISAFGARITDSRAGQVSTDGAGFRPLQADGRLELEGHAAGWTAEAPLPPTTGAQQAPEALTTMLLRVKELGDDARAASLAPVIIAVGLAIIFLCFVMDPTRRSRTQQQQQQEEAEVVAAPDACPGRGTSQMPLSVLIALTSYRFYTGFLAATWVPFLMAKEGHVLVQDRQSLFMGVGKLIYGFSIVLNPIFGLLSDKLAARHPWCGRSSFLIAGVAIAAAGIYAAKLASDARDMWWYLAASSIWMLGEALADTVTEAIVPELLPRSQYNIAGSIRSLHFIAGGLTGYLLLLVFHDLHYHWLYVAYMSLMLVCALATVVIMRNKSPVSASFEQRHPRSSGSPLLASLVEAYVVPMRYSGGFPQACLCLFTFSLGTAPIFFTLLMVRDLVGIDSATEQQMHFSCISIVFLICAAISSVAAGSDGGGSAAADNHSATEDFPPAVGDASPSSASEGPGRADPVVLARSDGEEAKAGGDIWCFMIASTIAFGCLCAVVPAVCLPASVGQRLVALYVVSGFLGLSFGGVYSRFQTCTWSLLPSGVNVANAMGFAAVMKVTGCGLGNFIAGLILDTFRVGGNVEHMGTVGYILMSWFCALCVFVCVCLITGIRRGQKRVLSFGRCFCLC